MSQPSPSPRGAGPVRAVLVLACALASGAVGCASGDGTPATPTTAAPATTTTAAPGTTAPGDPGPGTTAPPEPAVIPGSEVFDYGDDPALDELWDACAAGSGKACDDLYFSAPVDSVYEEFGYTCGERPTIIRCIELDDPDSGSGAGPTPG